MNRKKSQPESKISHNEDGSKGNKSTGKIIKKTKMGSGEEIYAVVFQSSPVAMALATIPEGKLIEVNQAWLEMVGITDKENILGKTTGEAGLIPDAGSGENILNEFNQHGSVKNAEITANTRNGNRITLLVNVKMVEIGGIKYMLSTNEDITGRKQDKEKLRLSEMTFSGLVERAPFGIYVIDSDFRIAHMNAGSQTGAFRNVRPVIGRDFAEAMHILWPEEVAEGIIAKFRHTLNTGETYHSPVFTNPRHDLETVESYEWELHRTILPDGQYGVICYYFDSTELQKTEAALRESEERFKAIAEASPVGMGVVSIPEGKYLYINPAYEKYFGYNKEELLNKKSLDIYWDKNDRELLLKRLQEDNYVSNYELKLKRKDGSSFWSMSSIRKISFVKNLAYLGTFIDITGRKEAEEKLADARNKLKIALENGNIGVWEWNMITDEVNWDERMEIMFGLESGTFGRTYEAFENLVLEEDLSHIRNAMKISLGEDLPYETLYRIRLKGGKIKYISSKALVSKDRNGKPISLSGVCFDVTGLREGTAQLIEKLNEELLRSNKELESFAYVASHDLQEPLRMVTSFTQLLSQQYEDKLDEKAREYIRFAVDGSKRMYDLLNGLLAYSRIHTKGKSFNRVELSRILENTTRNLANKITERNAVIKSCELPEVIADESQMTQLFQNLISNSLKYSTESPRIEISSRSDTDQYIISVKDNGIGIESQYFDRIFVIFQRLFPKGELYEGTGIGLAICKKIVERHGGNIWVESVPGKGSTFTFSLPKTDE